MFLFDPAWWTAVGVWRIAGELEAQREMQQREILRVTPCPHCGLTDFQHDPYCVRALHRLKRPKEPRAAAKPKERREPHFDIPSVHAAPAGLTPFPPTLEAPRQRIGQQRYLPSRQVIEPGK
jgi:hypothetical protein